MLEYSYSTIASGATAIGSAELAPDKICIIKEEQVSIFLHHSYIFCGGLFQPILDKYWSIASGATPIGSAGRTPDETSKLYENEGTSSLYILDCKYSSIASELLLLGALNADPIGKKNGQNNQKLGVKLKNTCSGGKYFMNI
jgi:hypothetical protein